MSLKSHKNELFKNKKQPINKKQSKKKKDGYPSPLPEGYKYIKSDKKKVVAYIRVSTKSKSQETSIDKNQPALIESMLRKEHINKEYELLAYYPEWYTGTSIIRPVFKTLLADAGIEIEKKEGYSYPDAENPNITEPVFNVSLKIVGTRKYDEIWVKSTSRFSRNISILPVLELLKQNKVIVRFLDIGMSTEKDSITAISDQISADMRYSENLSKNIKASKAFAIESGEPPLHDTYGYDLEKISETSKGKLIENKEEADIVRFIYDVYLNGFNGEEYGTARLSKLLSMETPEDLEKNQKGKKPMLTRKGKPFASSTLYKILKNETYTGYKKHGKYADEKDSLFDLDKKQKVNENIEMIRDERVDIIIDKDTWDKVQNKLIYGDENISAEEAKKIDKVRKKEEKDKAKTSVNPRRNRYSKYLECGFCHKHFRHDNNSGNPYYTCSTKEDEGVAACNVSNIYDDQLDEFVERYAKSDFNELFKIDIINKIESLLNYAENTMFHFSNSSNINEYNDLVKQKKTAEDNLTALIRTNSTNKSIQDNIIYLTQTIDALDSKLKKLNAPASEDANNIEKSFKAVNMVLKYYKDLPQEYTNEQMLERLDRIVVNSERNTTGNKRPNPVLIPYFKYTTNEDIDDFINTLDIEMPVYTYQLLSGIEHYDTIDSYINDKKLNDDLKNYLENFNTLEEAQEYSKNYFKNDNSITNADYFKPIKDDFADKTYEEFKDYLEKLRTYITYFETMEEALAENKLSLYDKDIRQKDFIKPYLGDIPMVKLNYNMDDLNRKYGEKVITFNEKGEQIETVGHSFNMGVDDKVYEDKPKKIKKDEEWVVPKEIKDMFKSDKGPPPKIITDKFENSEDTPKNEIPYAIKQKRLSSFKPKQHIDLDKEHLNPEEYFSNLGPLYHDPMDYLKNRLNTLQSAFKSLQGQYK